LYKAVGWDQTTQSYTGKTEWRNGYVFIICLILFISITHSTWLLVELNVKLVMVLLKRMKSKAICSVNDGVVYQLSQSD
jgi:hypothetical protein